MRVLLQPPFKSPFETPFGRGWGWMRAGSPRPKSPRELSNEMRSNSSLPQHATAALYIFQKHEDRRRPDNAKVDGALYHLLNMSSAAKSRADKRRPHRGHSLQHSPDISPPLTSDGGARVARVVPTAPHNATQSCAARKIAKKSSMLREFSEIPSLSARAFEARPLNAA